MTQIDTEEENDPQIVADKERIMLIKLKFYFDINYYNFLFIIFNI
jgi:hypothetical protein